MRAGRPGFVWPHPRVRPSVLVESVAMANTGLDRFIGRIPITAALKTLTEADLLRVLQEPKNALVKQYTELFAASGVQLLCVSPRDPPALLH